jgi:hypothetical protein
MSKKATGKAISQKSIKKTASNKATYKRRSNKTDNNKKKLLQALEQHLGNVSKACKSINQSRSQHYVWLDEDPKYEKAVKALEEAQIDFVEDKLFQKINGVQKIVKGPDGKDMAVYETPPDTTACIFYLKTKGKNRGYIERMEVENKNVDEFSNLSDEELAEELKKLEDE